MSENFDFELAKLLRAQAPHDESIHSILIRTLLAYDPNVKPIGVISNSGFGRMLLLFIRGMSTFSIVILTMFC